MTVSPLPGFFGLLAVITVVRGVVVIVDTNKKAAPKRCLFVCRFYWKTVPAITFVGAP
jgi:hypothetical protein